MAVAPSRLEHAHLGVLDNRSPHTPIVGQQVGVESLGKRYISRVLHREVASPKQNSLQKVQVPMPRQGQVTQVMTRFGLRILQWPGLASRIDLNRNQLRTCRQVVQSLRKRPSSPLDPATSPPAPPSPPSTRSSWAAGG